MALNILIVDDSPVMRTFVRKAIDLAGIPVGEYREAGDGEEALKTLAEQWVDLVLTDINMPRLNGEELIVRMRSDELLHSIPVIVVSTDSSHSRMERMMRLGARGYISKPFLPEILRDEVERVVGVRHGDA